MKMMHLVGSEMTRFHFASIACGYRGPVLEIFNCGGPYFERRSDEIQLSIRTRNRR